MSTSQNDYFPELTRVRQLTDSYCGPAVLQMLFSFYSFWTAQGHIIEAANVMNRINDHGTTVQDLARAATILAPHFTFWYKDYSIVNDLHELTEVHHHPVAVEWQGVFGDDYTVDYDGHYSVITHVNLEEGYLQLADPYPDFAGRDRRFNLVEFNKRWWDFNEVLDPATGETKHVRDERMMFIVTEPNATFPLEIGMKMWKSALTP